MAVAVEEHGREIVEVYLQAMRKGDSRAAEALMSRIYGKPEETMRQVETNPASAVLKSMSLDEKLELLRRLQAGEPRAPSALEAHTDWAAKIVEENGRDLAESFLSAARNGDWRAAEALMNRIYGKPDATPVAHVPPNPMIDVIRAMSLEEKLELLGRLREGELADTATALPIVEAVPRSR